MLSRVWLFATLWTVACQLPLSMELSRQENWTGLLFPSPGDLPNAGIEPRSPTLQADSLPSKPPGKLYFKEQIDLNIWKANGKGSTRLAGRKGHHFCWEGLAWVLPCQNSVLNARVYE